MSAWRHSRNLILGIDSCGILHIFGLVVSGQSLTTEVRVPFPGGQNTHKLVNSDIGNFLLKTNEGRDRRPNFAIFVVWSASNVSAEFLAREESISSPSFYWPTIIHMFLALSSQIGLCLCLCIIYFDLACNSPI